MADERGQGERETASQERVEAEHQRRLCRCFTCEEDQQHVERGPQSSPPAQERQGSPPNLVEPDTRSSCAGAPEELGRGPSVIWIQQVLYVVKLADGESLADLGEPMQEEEKRQECGRTIGEWAEHAFRVRTAARECQTEHPPTPAQNAPGDPTAAARGCQSGRPEQLPCLPGGAISSNALHPRSIPAARTRRQKSGSTRNQMYEGRPVRL